MGTDLRQQCGFKDESDLFWMHMSRMQCADAGSKPLIVGRCWEGIVCFWVRNATPDPYFGEGGGGIGDERAGPQPRPVIG